MEFLKRHAVWIIAAIVILYLFKKSASNPHPGIPGIKVVQGDKLGNTAGQLPGGISFAAQGLAQEYDIGYKPGQNEVRYGSPQTSLFGNAIRGGFNPLGGANYEWFVTEPYRWPTNFYSKQVAGIRQQEFLYGQYFGYRGILPIGLQSVSPEPYPYQKNYPYNMSP